MHGEGGAAAPIAWGRPGRGALCAASRLSPIPEISTGRESPRTDPEAGIARFRLSCTPACQKLPTTGGEIRTSSVKRPACARTSADAISRHPAASAMHGAGPCHRPGDGPGLAFASNIQCIQFLQCLPHDQPRNHRVPESRQNRRPLFTARRDTPSVSRIVCA